jgi:DNA-binding transcriptional regulator/RsmH inhibitor MraZ
LNKEVILLGMNYKFEVWDHRRWKEKEEQILQSSEEIKMALASLGL